MRAILIDVNRQEVREVNVTGKLASIQRAIDPDGCYIELGLRLPDDHVLYVDEEGLHKPTRGFFRFLGLDRPFAGNGLILGSHGPAEASATVPLAVIARAVRFLTRPQVDAWAKATASDPEIYIETEEGIEVIATRGQVWGDMPSVEEEKE